MGGGTHSPYWVPLDYINGVQFTYIREQTSRTLKPFKSLLCIETSGRRLVHDPKLLDRHKWGFQKLHPLACRLQLLNNRHNSKWTNAVFSVFKGYLLTWRVCIQLDKYTKMLENEFAFGKVVWKHVYGRKLNVREERGMQETQAKGEHVCDLVEKRVSHKVHREGPCVCGKTYHGESRMYVGKSRVCFTHL